MPGHPDPAAYAQLDYALLEQVFRQGPARIRQAVDGLSAAELRARSIPDKWSILEIVCYLADAETMGAGRFRQIFTQRNRDLVYYGPAERATLLRYQDTDAAALEKQLTRFDLLRQLTLPILRRATPEDWLKTGNHPVRGPITLRQTLELYADHSERHLGQILERRRLLGKPLDMALLLPERLY